MNCQKIASKKRILNLMKRVNNLGLRIVFLLTIAISLSVTAMAQCGASFTAMAASAASVRSQSQVSPAQDKSSTANDAAADASIVGLWHIRFQVGDQTIQEAFQIWNEGGTEVHNPNVDPRQGNVCLGAWEQAPARTFKLTHRVWLYDSSGNFQGTGHLSETLVLGDKGNTHSGSFTLAFYDPAGNFLFEVPGTVIGQRISVN